MRHPWEKAGSWLSNCMMRYAYLRLYLGLGTGSVFIVISILYTKLPLFPFFMIYNVTNFSFVLFVATL